MGYVFENKWPSCFCLTFSVSVLLCTGVIADDLLIVPHGAENHSFCIHELGGEDAHPPGGNIIPLSQPVHGDLSFDGRCFMFLPYGEFTERGIDLFHYLPATGGPAEAVFLVTDQKVLALDTVRVGAHFYTGDSTQEGGNADFQMESGQQSAISSPPPVEDLDGTLRVATALGRNGLPIFSLDYDLTPGNQLLVRAYDDLGDERLLSIPDVSGGALSLPWWNENPLGACNGGLLVLVDGDLRGAITGLCNAEQAVRGWAFDETAVNIDGVLIWGSGKTPAFPPVLGDGFEAGMPLAWDTGAAAGYLKARREAALTGDWGLEATVPPSAAEIAFLAGPLQTGPYYRGRFSLALPSAGALSGTVALLWVESPEGREVLRIDLEAAAEVRLRAVANDSSTSLELPWVQIDPLQPVEVEVEWWAPSVDPAGGIRLRIDSEIVAQGMPLQPPTAAARTYFGVRPLGHGASGVVYLDEVFTWR